MIQDGSLYCRKPRLLFVEFVNGLYQTVQGLLNGNIPDLCAGRGGIAAAAHEKGIPLIVDSAHGAHLGYHPGFPRSAISQGADLVIGHHPHVVQEVETYKGKQIAYSLGNLSFGGNRNPSDKNCLIFQQTFTVGLDSRDVEGSSYRAVPYTVSSVDYRNDYRPTPA